MTAAAAGEKAIDGIGEAGRRAVGGLTQVEGATERVGRAAVDLTGIESRLEGVIAAVQQSTVGAARGHAALRDAIVAQANATTGAVTATNALGTAHESAATDANALAIAERNLAAATSEAERASAAAALAALKLSQAQEGGVRSNKLVKDGIDEATAAANRQGYAVRNVGQQFGDFGLSVASGISPARAFGQQAGQLGFALSEMGGTLGKVGAFLVGPWGIALTVGAAVLAPFVEKLFQSGSAAEESRKKLTDAAAAADSYGNAQSLLGKVIDLTTGKLKTQNAILIQTIKLQAQANILAAQADQKTASKALTAIGDPTLGERLGVVLAGSATQGQATAGEAAKLAATLAPVKDVVRDYVALTSIANASQSALDKGLSGTIRRLDALAASGRLTSRDLIAAKTAVISLGTTLNDQKANQLVLDAIDGKGIDPLLKPYERGKKPKKPKDTSAKVAALAEFGNDTADKLASLRDGLDATPSAVRAVNQQVRQLDDLIDDLAKKKPPNFKELIADAKALRPLIVDSINKPFDDFVKSQANSLEILKLQAAGQTDQAEALRVILGLERQIGPLTPARKDAVLATVEALRAEQRQIDINREHVGLYLTALGSIKTVVQDATQAFVRGDLGQFIKAPGKLLDAFKTLQGQVLFEKVFGSIFRDLQDQANGTKTVEDASDRMADAVDQVSAATKDTTAALASLATASRGAAGAIAGPTPGGGSVSAATTLAGAVGQAGDLGGSIYDSDPRIGDALGTGSDIVVTGRRSPSITRNPTELFSQAIGQVATKVGGLFTNPENAAKIGANIGKFAGKGLEGAATGTLVAGLAKTFGVKLNQTGSQVGGAIGGITGLPGGAVVGSVLGGLVGNLFSKPKYGTASISGGSDGTTIATGGNSGSVKSAAGTLAGSVQAGVESIAKQLGAQLGSYKVSIGTFDGQYRVSTTGFTGSLDSKKAKNEGLVGFGKDGEAAAIAFAISDAIKDGAVKGLSAAVQAALSSTTDVDKALQEALGVKSLENSLGGVAGSIKAAFDAEDAAAKERVRLAKTYGLDLIAVEKLNGEARAKLIADTLRSSVGSLQDLLSDLASGDLFEGTAADRRKALLAQIGDTQARANAGETGAADELATLYRNLLATSREAFGTAGGEYSSDRTTAQAGAAAVIKAEQERIASASGQAVATTAAIEKGNTLTAETNDLLAVLNAKIDAMAGALAASGYSDALDYSTTARASSFT